MWNAIGLVQDFRITESISYDDNHYTTGTYSSELNRGLSPTAAVGLIHNTIIISSNNNNRNYIICRSSTINNIYSCRSSDIIINNNPKETTVMFFTRLLGGWATRAK